MLDDWEDRNYLRAGHSERVGGEDAGRLGKTELSKSRTQSERVGERTLDDWERQKLSKSRTPSERVGGEDAG